MDDRELLREYTERQSERAFAELVGRHVNLVYSTALRMVRETTLAEDVTQSVFVQLARKAATVREGNALPGWLYRVTHCQAVNALRAEHSRRQREKEAMNRAELDHNPPLAWESIAPDLEDAMSTLSDTDQNAVVLRFFQGRSWREVSGALELSEDAAQKRVSRAVEKLRSYFVRRGMGISSALIASFIAANAVHAAPVGLASTVTTASLAAAAGTGSFGLISTFIQTMLMKKTTCAVLGLVLAAAVTIPLIIAKADQSGAPVTEVSLRKGLVLHFPFDQAEVDGKVTDASGAQNHGRVVGAKWTSVGRRGGALQFAPPNQYVRVSNSDSLNPSQLTLAAWIKTSRNDDTWRRVFDKSWTGGYALSIGGGWTPGNKFKGRAVIEMAMKNNRNKGIAASDRVVTDGRWHHVVTTYNGAEQALYVDGVQQKHEARWAGSIPKNSHDLTIGINLIDPNSKYGEVGASFDGLIDEPMIFNRALSPKEVAFLFNTQQ